MTQQNESLLVELLTEMRDDIKTMREFMEKREASYQTKVSGEELTKVLRTKSDFAVIDAAAYEAVKAQKYKEVKGGYFSVPRETTEDDVDYSTKGK